MFVFSDLNQSSLSNKEYSIMMAISKLFQLYDRRKLIYFNSTVAVALWAIESDAMISPDLQLTLDGVYDGGVGKVRTDSPGWSSLGRDCQ